MLFDMYQFSIYVLYFICNILHDILWNCIFHHILTVIFLSKFYDKLLRFFEI